MALFLVARIRVSGLNEKRTSNKRLIVSILFVAVVAPSLVLRVDCWLVGWDCLNRDTGSSCQSLALVK